jgi:transcriptional regulator with XRE-family HTH domain
VGFAQNLCDLMRKRGVGSYKLAKDIGVHTSTVSNWRDGTEPKLEHLTRLAKYFGVPIEELLAPDGAKQDSA